MASKFKTPLSVCVFYDEDFTEGENIYNNLYSALCREPNDPLSDGLDIPVFFHTKQCNDYHIILDNSISNKIVCILLIDERMFYNGIYWEECIKKLMHYHSEGKVDILPVALCDYAFNYNNLFHGIQYLRFDYSDLNNNWLHFEVSIFESLIRILRGNMTEKVKLFISHSKKDTNHLGEYNAHQLKDYLRSNTKLDSFFDASDILEGYGFENQIKESIKKSCLVILESTSYSSREWCRIETLIGKTERVPTVVVSLIDGVVQRTFPYLGNVPKIRFDGTWDKVIHLLMRTALDIVYQSQYLESLAHSFQLEKECILPVAPELLLLKPKDDIVTYLYPEPPLGNEELHILKKWLKPETAVVTPCQIYQQNSVVAENTKVAISISDSSDADKLGIGKKMFADISVEIARHLLVMGCKLVYGGDLRNGGFTQLFSELSYQYGVNEKTDVSHNYFENYFSWPIYNQLSIDDRIHFKSQRVSCIDAVIPDCVPTELRNQNVKPDSLENKNYWIEALTAMRKQMESNVHARIALGGNTEKYMGRMPGIFEEVLLAFESHHPLYIVGGFGGAAFRLVNLLEGNESAKKLGFEELAILEGKAKLLDNGLSLEENRMLFTSINLTEIVGLIAKGLNEKFKRNV